MCAAQDYEGGMMPFEDVGRFLRYMNPRMHRRDGGGAEEGTIAENEARAKELQGQDDAEAQPESLDAEPRGLFASFKELFGNPHVQAAYNEARRRSEWMRPDAARRREEEFKRVHGHAEDAENFHRAAGEQRRSLAQNSFAFA